METEKRLIEYYVVQNKSTDFYFRGKGANRWGQYHNQASIYRSRAHAENTANWLKLRGEQVEIVPIRIIENPTVDAVEVVHGRWIEKQEPIPWCEDDVDVFCVCSVCDCASPGESSYCPNCGAKMDGDGNG